MPRPAIYLPLLLALVAACETSRNSVSPSVASLAASDPSANTVPQARTGWEVSEEPVESPLYGWDGSPVRTAAPGTVERVEVASPRASEEERGSRLVLLELYNQAVEERDEYLLEVEAQNQELAQVRAEKAEVERRMQELQSAYDGLAARTSALEVEAQDLAARLALAQVRRLEAEKAWLESAIQVEEARVRALAPADSAEGKQ